MKLLALLLVVSLPAWAEDSFTVKELRGKQAVVTGPGKELKSGDFLYLGRSPFRFRIDSVTDNQVTIQLPAKSDLAIGNSLLKTPNEAIKKGIATEERLKEALGE